MRGWITAIVFISVFLGSQTHLGAQSIVLDRSVIGSTGGTSTQGAVELSSTTGEVVIETAENQELILTQGFQQPEADEVLPLLVALTGQNATCSNSGDGMAYATLLNATFPVTYSWENNPLNTDTLFGLQPGLYVLEVTDAIGRIGRDTVEIVADSDDLCGLHIYTGLTPNGDEHNDSWVLENIDLYPDNEVQVFNRWGDLVWNTSGYNNLGNNWIGDHNNGNPLPEGTYFFIVNVDGLNPYKGWVQLSR